MADESCPLPASNRRPDRENAIVERLIRAQRIAVVGLSDDPGRAAWMIASYLKSIGRTVIPVNPQFTELMGERCFPSVQAIEQGVDLVNVFRRPQFCPTVVEDAIAAHAAGVWLQSGIVSAEARKLADAAGIDYIENRCLMVEIMHAR